MSENPQQFESLIRDYAKVMSAAIRRVCSRHCPSLVHDVQQEVYLALWKRLKFAGKIEHPTSYLYKVALTTALTVIRRLKLDETGSLEEEGEPGSPDAPGLAGLLPAERSILLEQVLAQLNPDQSRALRAYLLGFNHKEVADLFGWSESVARHNIYRSIEDLKRRLKHHDPRVARQA